MLHEDWMRCALRIAAEDDNEIPVGAIIVYQGKAIASAHNERETKNMPFAHAEILAMQRAAEKTGARRLTGCTLYVTLEPCVMCAGAMVMAELDICIFGTFDNRQGCCGSVYDITQDPMFSHHVRCLGGVMESESQDLLDNFFSRKRLKV